MFNLYHAYPLVLDDLYVKSVQYLLMARVTIFTVFVNAKPSTSIEEQAGDKRYLLSNTLIISYLYNFLPVMWLSVLGPISQLMCDTLSRIVPYSQDELQYKGIVFSFSHKIICIYPPSHVQLFNTIYLKLGLIWDFSNAAFHCTVLLLSSHPLLG